METLFVQRVGMVSTGREHQKRHRAPLAHHSTRHGPHQQPAQTWHLYIQRQRHQRHQTHHHTHHRALVSKPQRRHTQTRPRQLARQREGRIDWLSSIQKWGNATQPRTGRTGQTLHAHPFERTDAQSVGRVV